MSTAQPPVFPPVTAFADFTAGAVLRSYSRTITEADLVSFTSFAGLRLPLFIDAEYARTQGPFGERICPGFLTASISAGMLESILGANTLAGLGMDRFRFKTPVKIGDTLHAEVGVESKRDTREPGKGVLTVQVQVLNQRGETALEYSATVLMRR
jgi:acyl dehydratase